MFVSKERIESIIELLNYIEFIIDYDTFNEEKKSLILSFNM